MDSYDPTPGPDPERVVMTQRWSELVFLHWAYDPDEVEPLLPRGTRADVFDGSTWIGLIAFMMRDVAVLGTPPIPYLSTFPEVNVRAYAIGADGRRSVVFLSLDISRLLPVAAARAGYGLPYIWSSMRHEHRGDELSYGVRRRGRTPATANIRVRVGDPVRASPLDDFLTARWGLHQRWLGTTSHVPIAHQPWALRSAELLDLHDDLIPAAGLSAPDGPPRVLYADGVDVRLGIPARMRPRSPTHLPDADPVTNAATP